jgi:SAM-dependent methyltransferase
MDGVLALTRDAALVAWAVRVRGNRQQAERFRERPERPDFYAPVASAFKADPDRTDEPALNYLRALVQPGETWLDIGAGGGRYALPLARLAREVIVVEPSDGMLSVLREGMAEHDITNIRIINSRWPMDPPPPADVAFIAHVGYDIEDIGPFLDAMEASAKRLCVAVLLAESPAQVAAPFWPPIHGEDRIPLPALAEFVALQLARGKLCSVWLSERAPSRYRDREMALRGLRQQLFIEPGGAKDARLVELADDYFGGAQEGVVYGGDPIPLGVVTWAPS